MNSEEKQKLDEHLKPIAEILVNNIPKENLKIFESIELAVREHMLTEVSSQLEFFFGKSNQNKSRT